MSKHDGGPAFPCDELVTRDENGLLNGAPVSSHGMSLRDWFAGQATGEDIAAHQEWDIDEFGTPCPKNTREQAKYLYADAMIVAREAQP